MCYSVLCMTETTQPTCPDCGNAPVNHAAEKFDIWLSWTFKPITKPFENLMMVIASWTFPFLSHYFLPAFFKFLTFVHLGKIAHNPDEKTSGRATVFWNEAKSRGIDMWEFQLFGLGRELFVATFNGTSITFDGLPRPGVGYSKSLSWMDNKGIMRKKFKAAGICVANGGDTGSLKKALQLFNTLNKPVIVKPNLGSRSRHTTTHIATQEEFIIAFKKAKQLSPWVVVEENLIGLVHRATLIGGKLVAVLRREPPCVWGDGVHTVGQLIDIENQNPTRKEEKIFHTIKISDEVLQELKRQNITLESVVADKQLVTLHQKASRGLGGGATDVTAHVHPDNVAVLELADSVLHDPLVGVDFIIDDISKSYKDQPRSGVIECNSLPFIDLHHFPLKGDVQNVAGALWDITFPESKK